MGRAVPWPKSLIAAWVGASGFFTWIAIQANGGLDLGDVRQALIAASTFSLALGLYGIGAMLLFSSQDRELSPVPPMVAIGAHTILFFVLLIVASA